MTRINLHRPMDGDASSLPNDETLVALSIDSGSQTSSNSRLREEARGKIALVEGSTPHLSSETRDVLRSRLRIAAVLFFVTFLAFLSRWAFHWDVWGRPEHRWLFYTHAVVTMLLGAFAIKLCGKCTYTLPKLRTRRTACVRLPGIFLFVEAASRNRFRDASTGRKSLHSGDCSGLGDVDFHLCHVHSQTPGSERPSFWE